MKEPFKYDRIMTDQISQNGSFSNKFSVTEVRSAMLFHEFMKYPSYVIKIILNILLKITCNSSLTAVFSNPARS